MKYKNKLTGEVVDNIVITGTSLKDISKVMEQYEEVEEIKYTLKDEEGNDVEVHVGDEVWVKLDNVNVCGDNINWLCTTICKLYKDIIMVKGSSTYFQNKTGKTHIGDIFEKYVTIIPPKPEINIPIFSKPEGYDWYAVDKDGVGWWFISKPIINRSAWMGKNSVYYTKKGNVHHELLNENNIVENWDKMCYYVGEKK